MTHYFRSDSNFQTGILNFVGFGSQPVALKNNLMVNISQIESLAASAINKTQPWHPHFEIKIQT